MSIVEKVQRYLRQLTRADAVELLPFLDEYTGFDLWYTGSGSVSATVCDSSGYRFDFSLTLVSSVFPYTTIDSLVFRFAPNWKTFIRDNQLTKRISSNVDESVSGKLFVKELTDQFLSAFRKPESRGNVKVYLDASKRFWFWKRPYSTTFTEGPDGEKYLNETCPQVVKVYGRQERGEWKFLTQSEQTAAMRLSSRNSCPYVLRGTRYYWKDSLVPIYHNSIPFDNEVERIPPDEINRYEFVIVNGERRIINVRRADNLLTDRPIHSYSTRIESLVPLEKLFKKGKSDLYAARPQEETPFIGFELEACTNKAEVDKAECASTVKEFMPFEVMCKSDGSISPDGFETVSIPGTLDYWKESSLSTMLDAMRSPPYNMRSFEHSSCGFHAHVSRSALSVLDLQKMERFMNNPDNKKFLEEVAGRSSNTYQKYNPSLFNKRSAPLLNSSGEQRIDGLVYLSNRSYVESALANYMSTRRVNLHSKLKAIAFWISGGVSYSSLAEFVIDNNLHTLLEQEFELTWGPEVRNSIPQYVCSALREDDLDAGYTRQVLPRGYHDRNTETLDRIAKRLFWLIASRSPRFAELIQPYFTDWDWTDVTFPSNEAPEENAPTPAWKLKPLKSKAPYKRVLSFTAAQTVVGPVGKSGQRYDVLNTNNRNTIEFRLFKGTMNPSSVFRYLEFVDALVRFVASTSATNDGVSHQKFVKWLVGDSFNVIRYEHLVSFITEKGYFERKKIRKKSLPVVSSKDYGLTVESKVKPVGFFKPDSYSPLGEFNTNTRPEETAPSVYLAPDYEPDEDDYEHDEDDYNQSDGDYIPDCNCPDCVSARGFEV